MHIPEAEDEEDDDTLSKSSDNSNSDFTPSNLLNQFGDINE